MKKSVILEIFNGTRGPIDTLPKAEKNDEIEKIIRDVGEELREKLSPELFKLHERLLDAISRDWLNEVDFYFVQGFKLGLHIGIESME